MLLVNVAAIVIIVLDLMDKNKSRPGFTIIELLVVISIGIIFAGMSLARYNTYSSQSKLISDGRKLVDVLELAKKKALSSDLLITPGTPQTFCSNFTGYKVVLSESSYSLNYCCALVCTKVQDYALVSGNTISSGLGNYTFTPLMINPFFSSSTISLYNSNITKTINININSVGVISLDETLL